MLECSSTLLYPVSLLRLGTGWEPPIRGSEMFERFPRPNLTDFFHFFCKKHMAYPFPNITYFFGRAQNLFPSQNWPFFWVPPLFQNWGAFAKIEGLGCERILVILLDQASCLLLTEGAFAKIEGPSPKLRGWAAPQCWKTAPPLTKTAN